MTVIAERTVLFADLRGSTSLFEQLGNAEATSVVTHTIGALGRAVTGAQGKVVKTLGDGLMAVFETPLPAIQGAAALHETLLELVSRGHTRGASSGLRLLRLQVAMAHGEVVEMGGDCFGDAVNVAARLLDHAGDNETLLTDDVWRRLPPVERGRFRSLDWVHLRGRAEPVLVYLAGRAEDASPATQFGHVTHGRAPEGLRLAWHDRAQVFGGHQMPIVLGRSPQAAFCIDDTRVSRSHARIDWHGGAFQLTDLSYNGSYVRFGQDRAIVTLRRGSCTLHGRGSLGLGAPPTDADAAVVDFEILRFAETEPQGLPAAR